MLKELEAMLGPPLCSHFSLIFGTSTGAIIAALLALGCFFTSSGDRIVNYPQQHSANCTAKHKATNGWFKPMIRILKNMRSQLVDDGVIEDGTAPSYFLEGLLHNVPNDRFGGSYGDTFVAAMNWIGRAKQIRVCQPSALSHKGFVRHVLAVR